MVGSRVNFTKEDIGGEIPPILTTGLYRNTLVLQRRFLWRGDSCEEIEPATAPLRSYHDR